jgi:hypothetical protein
MSDADNTATVDYRSIPGFPGYRVGNDGSVFGSSKRGSHDWYLLKPWSDKDGYLSVALKNEDGYKHFRIHRLVLALFVGECPDGMVAAHNNGNRSDNRVGNLRWDTQAGNIADKVAHGTSQRGERHGMARLRESDIVEMFTLANSGLFAREIAPQFGVRPVTVKKILSRSLWSHVDVPELRTPDLELQQRAISMLIAGGRSTSAIAQLAGTSLAMINAVRRGQRRMRLSHELKLVG